MKQQIKEMTVAQVGEFIDVIRNAYPSMSIHSDEDRQKAIDRTVYQLKNKETYLYGLYRDDRLLGGMGLHNYVMTLRGRQIPTGGGGMLGVDLAHKKEHVARDLVKFFFDHYRRQDYSMAIFWPFRHDFYRDMGAGYGATGMHHRFKPSQLPRGKGKEHIRELTIDDAAAIADCVNRVGSHINGMIRDTEAGYRQWFDLRKNMRWYGFVRDGKVLGFMNFVFQKGSSGSFLHNEIQIMQWVSDDRAVLMEMVDFLRAQADQIEMISYTSYDPDFHHLLLDPRNDSRRIYFPVSHEIAAGTLGVMYRVLDTEKLFAQMTADSFNNMDVTIGMHLEDDFIDDNTGYYRVTFTPGEAPQVLREQGDIDATIRLGVADFSSMVMGSVDFRSLHLYGRVEIDDERKIDLINRIFHTTTRPYCILPF